MKAFRNILNDPVVQGVAGVIACTGSRACRWCGSCSSCDASATFNKDPLKYMFSKFQMGRPPGRDWAGVVQSEVTDGETEFPHG